MSKKTALDILDPQVLEELRHLKGEAGGTLLDQVVGLFLRSAPQQLELMKNSLGKADAWSLENASAKLKLSCENLGAYDLQNICANFERWASTGEMERIHEEFPNFESEFAKLGQALNALKPKARKTA